MKAFDDIVDPREIRRRLGLNQHEFWSRIGVTQSGGSRYESGRTMPKPVRELLRLVHVEQIDLAKIKRDDLGIVEYLKSSDPELYKSLKKAARATRKKSDPSAAHTLSRTAAPACSISAANTFSHSPGSGDSRAASGRREGRAKP